MGFLTILIIAALLFGLWSYSEHLIESLENQAERISFLQATIRTQEDVLNVLAAPRLDHLILSGTPAFPQVSVSVFLDRSLGRAAIFIMNLPSQADRQVCLWILERETVLARVALKPGGESGFWSAVSLNGTSVRTEGRLLFTLESDSVFQRPAGEILASGTLHHRQ